MANKETSDLKDSLDYYLSVTELPCPKHEDDEWLHFENGGKWKKALPASQ